MTKSDDMLFQLINAVMENDLRWERKTILWVYEVAL